jgi:hypothetical protein
MLQLARGSHGSNDDNHQISANANVLVRLDHGVTSFRFASSNGITRSTFPVESKIPTSPERKREPK